MTVRKPLFFNYDEGISQEFNSTTDTVQLAQIAVTGIAGVGLDMASQRIINTPSPTDPTDAANKSYVDLMVQGLNLKLSVKAASDSNVATLSGTTTVDGVALAIKDRVLLFGQTNAVQNGIWLVQPGAWTRPTDFATGTHATTAFCFAEQGASYKDQGFSCITDSPTDVIDTNALVWTQISGAGQILAGAGLTKSGNNLAVALAPASGLQFTANALDHYLTPGGGLSKDANGLRTQLKAAGTATATLASDASGLGVLGLPNLFTVAGTATTGNVTAPNLNTLTGGPASAADALHTHQNVISAKVLGDTHVTSNALNAGDPVAWSSTASTLARGDAGVDAQARIIGVALSNVAANASGVIIKEGVAKNVLSGATPGAPVYLGLGGGLTFAQPSGTALRLVRLGWAVNATDLEVKIYDMGKRSA